MKKTILITGVTGTVGQTVLASLLQKDVTIKVGVRDLNKIKNAPWINQVEPAIFDYDKPETMEQALKGVDKLFLVTPPGGFQEKEIAENILKVGKSLQHVVRLSGMGAEKQAIFANHNEVDQLLLASKIDYTALRPNTFMQNFYNYSSSIKDKGAITDIVKTGKISFIDVRDIGEVAARVLAESTHANKIYELTGKESLNYFDVAEQFSEILGKQVVFHCVSEQEFIAAKEAEGVPGAFAERVMQFSRMIEEGEYERVSSAVETILGREPITLKQFISDHRDRFVE